jgi:hypothetical protein
MKMFRKNSRFIALIACLAMLLSILAPAISHAMDSRQGDALLVEVCSATGSKSAIAIQLNFEATPGQTQDNQDSQNMSMQHCAYCVMHGGHIALPHAPQPLALIPNLSYSLPELFYHAPRPLFAWAPRQPRAPPYSS